MPKFRLVSRAGPTIPYGTAVGLGVTNGRANLTPHGSATLIYVRSTGNDTTGNGTSGNPYLTLGKAISVVRQGFGDHILLCKGETFNDPCDSSMNDRGGLSQFYPTVIQTYDPAAPTDQTKFGLVNSESDMATINLTDTTGATNSCNSSLCNKNGNSGSYMVYRGLYIKMNANDDSTLNGAVSYIGQSTTTPQSYILFESCIFDRCTLGFNMGVGKATAFGNGAQYWPGAASNLVIRKCGFFGAWRGTIYISGMSNCVIEDNVFWHMGWQIGKTRTDASGSGGPFNQRHNLYCQWDSSGIARRNVSIEPSFDAFGLRGDWASEHNVSIAAPEHFRMGNGNLNNTGDTWTGTGLAPSEGAYRFPNGFLITCYRCVAIGGVIEGASSNVYTFGGLAAYTKSGSGFTECLFVKPNVPANATEALIHTATSTDSMIDSYCDFKDNLIVGYTNSIGNNSGGTTTYDAGAAYHPRRTFTGVNYIEGSTVDANRVTNSGLSFPNAYTDSSLATALGYGSVGAMGQAMALAPWTGHAKTLLTTIFAGYGRTLDATVLP